MIRKSLKDILKTASAREKAIMVCHGYDDKIINQQETSYTQEEVNAIISSITPEQDMEYNHLVSCYMAYRELASIFGLVNGEFTSILENTLGLLKIWEAYKQEENHLNSIIQAIRDESGKQASDIANTVISRMAIKKAHISINEEGYAVISIFEENGLYEEITGNIEPMHKVFSVLKALIIAIDEFTTKNCSEFMMPKPLRNSIRKIKDEAYFGLPLNYSRKYLKEKEDRGERISETERREAILPYYDEIEPDSVYLPIWRDKVKEISHEE